MSGEDQKPTRERRPLTEGLMPRTDVARRVEERFVRGDRATTDVAPAPEPQAATPPRTPAVPNHPVGKTPLSTRIRADYAAALKRASLERQLGGVTPNTLQDILEEALKPWLTANGYLTPSQT
jgi:cell pole-organizing protein PopZ